MHIQVRRESSMGALFLKLINFFWQDTLKLTSENKNNLLTEILNHEELQQDWLFVHPAGLGRSAKGGISFITRLNNTKGMTVNLSYFLMTSCSRSLNSFPSLMIVAAFNLMGTSACWITKWNIISAYNDANSPIVSMWWILREHDLRVSKWHKDSTEQTKYWQKF